MAHNVSVLKSSVQRDDRADWTDWRWQQKNTIRDLDSLLEVFPGLPEKERELLQRVLPTRRFSITPYTVEMMSRSVDGAPVEGDPIWRQFVPLFDPAAATEIEYDGETDNWELDGEMVTPICQHKYDNRVITRVTHACQSYCQYCYEAMRTLDKNSPKLGFKTQHWNDTIEYVRNNPQVDEVILSGGEPLMLDDEQLEGLMQDVRGIKRPLMLRIHTRSLTFNPFRVTDSFVELLKKYEVAALGIHVAHVREITPEFEAAVKKIQGAVPITFANIPLLAGINDSYEEMRALCWKLYTIGVIPHYLYHFMPYSPGTGYFRTSIQKGIDILSRMKRHLSNFAVPEFVLPHHTGKYTVPIAPTEDHMPSWGEDRDGRPVVRFKNWKDEAVVYPDIHI